ncbi:helix-turn-helix transcriptional regulator [Dyadobacter sp. CY261]|uniref:helix-turn-helix domain-containing protein n=1 Tax=Dyadobacter sp. CY261 TaxID=2907203 RepID=UPI001F165EAA|nr:response regulator transcription factor [Dyadobacter sp. CY261]MCF0075418.1 helix-turn-helix transcriptional regulator [Dyadobacter sp. CY261]
MPNAPIRISSIPQAHKMQGFAPPPHPMISLIKCGQLKGQPGMSAVLDFYMISIKRNCNNLIYGQQKYDFDEGFMAFIGPNQIISGQEHAPGYEPKGWMLFVHPDFFWGSPLAKKIKQYEFFNYAVNEALFLSDKEEKTINDIVGNIVQECNANIDHFTQNIVVSHLETLLNYAERFYQRQFITRKIANHQILDRLNGLLDDYFNSDDLVKSGIPTVEYISDVLNVSPGYLRSLLKNLTGQNTQQHIHEKLIDKAKEKLSTTSLSVSEIAYGLGFEHPQSFNKLFKTKTKVSPLEFRASFN